jgi:hypothetical protein
MSVELTTLLIWAVDLMTPPVIIRTNVVSNKKRFEQTTPHHKIHMVCCFVYNFKVFKFQIGHRSDFNRKFSICWNQTGHRFQRVEIGAVADFADGNQKSKWAFRGCKQNQNIPGLEHRPMVMELAKYILPYSLRTSILIRLDYIRVEWQTRFPGKQAGSLNI